MKIYVKTKNEMWNLMKINLTIFIFIFAPNIFGQIPPPNKPTIQTFEPFVPIPNYPIQNNYSTTSQKPTGFDLYEKDKQEQQRRQEQINSIYSEFENVSNSNVEYLLPSCLSLNGATSYQTAFYELMKMVEDENKFSVAKAVFLVENAYYENIGDFQSFKNAINEIVEFLNWKIDEYGYDQNDNLAKNMLLFRFFSDTLEIKSKNLIHYPFKYDFEDFSGREDWSKMFVSKAIMTNSGQCHSLPLLFLILADEIGANAQLSFSPSHTYIKFQDNNAKWYNIELTNGMLTTDAFILQSGYIKAEALSNKIYMQPLNDKQLISYMLFDLAKGYIAKYCYDEFVGQVINEAIRLDSTNINAQALKSDFLTLKFHYISLQLGINEQNYIQKLAQYPEANEIFIARNKQYDKMDNLGYEDMPTDVYERWLNSLNETKQKQQSEQIYIEINNKIEIKNIEIRK